jgi:cell division protein FtsL
MPGHPVGQIVQPELGGRRGIGVGAFLLALVTAGAMAHVGVRMKGIEVAYDLGHEKRVNTELEEERRRLNIEIGMLKDPVRVVSIARDKLKMGPPAPADVVRLGPGQVLGARPAAPADVPAKRERPAAKQTKRVTTNARTETRNETKSSAKDDAAKDETKSEAVTAPAPEGDE